MPVAIEPDIAPRILLVGLDPTFHCHVRGVIDAIEALVAGRTPGEQTWHRYSTELVERLAAPADARLHLLPDRAGRRTLVVRAGELCRQSTGADEYVSELPITPAAALLLGALLRRSLGPAPFEIVADELSIDVRTGVVALDGAVVPTDRTELAFLSFIAAHQGGSFTRAELSRAISAVAA